MNRSGRAYSIQWSVWGLIRLALTMIALWVVLLMLRSAPALPGLGSSGRGNTLVIPSKLQLHRHRHHREPVQPFPKLD